MDLGLANWIADNYAQHESIERLPDNSINEAVRVNYITPGYLR